ncbi:MAG: SUF system NifU family Fe-S cluster assembly protein [Armatimonadetes bacterium]|nr:SUF system NifU family Fe-S cluster assembly protein [Armatimonadota bacterium]
MGDLQELYQDLIIEHGKAPRNMGPLPQSTHEAEGFNPLCGDEVTVRLFVADGVIREAKFEGVGCAISTASASLLTEMVKGKSPAEALALSKSFRERITSEQASDAVDIGPLEALVGVREYPMRVKCATLAWHALREALENAVERAGNDG